MRLSRLPKCEVLQCSSSSIPELPNMRCSLLVIVSRALRIKEVVLFLIVSCAKALSLYDTSKKQVMGG
jgi:hypothetical protein